MRKLGRWAWIGLTWAATAVAGDFTWTTNSADTNTITVIGYAGAGGDVALPAIVEGKTVTAIGDWAFYNCASLTNLELPDSVKLIGGSAFNSCANLTNVALGNGLQCIGSSAFNLCSNLLRVALPAPVTNIGASAFWGCSGLLAIDVATGNATYASADGVLFNKSQTRLLQCPAKKAGSYSVPGTVTNIGAYAMYRCDSLSDIVLPASLARVEEMGLASCAGVTSITVNAGNLNFSSKNGVFFNKSQTVLLQFPPGKPGYYAVPGTVTNIQDGALASCGQLTEAVVPNSVVRIGNFGFCDCDGLTNVAIGTGVTKIGFGAFESCASLLAITVAAGNAVYSSTEGVLFNKGQTVLIQFPAGRTGNYVVPDIVTNIADSAFISCSGLTNVEIGAEVARIENFAFAGCNGLSAVALPGNVVHVGSYAFHACAALAEVMIGSGLAYIGDQAFDNGPSLSAVRFRGLPPGIGVSIFFNSPVTVYHLPGTAGWPVVPNAWAERPTALWLPRASPDGGLGVLEGRFAFTAEWAAGKTVLIEACTNMAAPEWVVLQTNVLAEDTALFDDPTWAEHASRFYRLREP